MTVQPMYEPCLHILYSTLRMFEPPDLVKELVMRVPSRMIPISCIVLQSFENVIHH